MNLFWAPGMSDAAREICRDLTTREKAALGALSFAFGLCAFAIPMVIMGSVTGLGPLPALPPGFTFPVVFGLVAAFWLIFVLRRRLLLGTRVAREKGFTMADINARHPLSREDNLTLLAVGGLAALVMATALAAAFLLAA